MPRPRSHALIAAALTACLCAPASARDSLGVFGNWGAFRDTSVPRCYAIAMAEPSTLERDYEPFASVGTWPRRGIRSQLHVRLSRKLSAIQPITLILGRERFTLVGGGGDAWAQDKRMDAAIIAAMRSAGTMIVNATDDRGRRFSNSFDLSGAATAMDAAMVGCARIR
jgi:hypothetical protein